MITYATVDGYMAWWAAQYARAGRSLPTFDRGLKANAVWYTRYFGAYDWACAGCGKTMLPTEAQIDHVHNDGNIERATQATMKGRTLAKAIVEGTVDRNRYQPLCSGCNSYKAVFGVTPPR